MPVAGDIESTPQVTDRLRVALQLIPDGIG
jgi:hypothetical protein